MADVQDGEVYVFGNVKACLDELEEKLQGTGEKIPSYSYLCRILNNGQKYEVDSLYGKFYVERVTIR